jgi:heme exporter protein A
MSDPVISLRGVWKYFGDFPAIRDVSFEVPSGTILALLGRNGAGKTTVLRMMAGLLRSSRGQIRVNPSEGQEANGRGSIGMVGHGEWIYDDLTAEENLEFFARLYRVKDAPRKIDYWLETTGLERFRRSRAAEFSRGMRQRLAIARAFLHEPNVVLLDEPWTALDDRATALLSSLVVDAQKRHRTVVICSHQLREALEVATDVVVLDRGRVVFQGPNDEQLKSSPDEFYQRIS